MKKHNLLVIEDERDLNNAFKIILEMNNFMVAQAFNGAEGLELLQTEKFDAVLCDIKLPGISGHEVLNAIRQNEATARQLFIFLTAYSDEKEIKNGIDNGADDYLTKPFTSKELIKKLNDHLAAANAKKPEKELEKRS